MSGTRIIAFAAAMLMLGTTALGNDPSPDEILKQVTATYKAMKTYKAEGTVTSDIEVDGRNIQMKTSFSMFLKKPNLYLISWTQSLPMSDLTQSGAVWSDGTQPYFYMGIMKAYSKMASNERALGGAAGISGGATSTIPSLFLSVSKEPSAPFSRLKDPKMEESEKVGEEECYVIAGASTMFKREAFWISKSRHLIMKSFRSFESPEGGMAIPEISDEKLEEALKDIGQEATEESKKKMRERMEKSRTMLKTTKAKGAFIELHEDVSSPELNESDFQFDLPKDVVLKKSLFGGMFDENKGIPNKGMNHDK